MTSLKSFLTESIKKPIFIGFSEDGKKTAFSKRFSGSKFLSWADLKIEDGNILAIDQPLTDFSMVIIGAIGKNYEISTCLEAFIIKNSIPHFFYGVSPENYNKPLQTVLMNFKGVSQIKTVICKAGNISAKSLIKKLKLPIISKITDGSQGKGIKKHDTLIELDIFLKKNKSEIYIFQEFIKNDGDYRVLFVKDKFVYSIKRFRGKDEFRNNVSLGGTQEFTELPVAAKSLALKACKTMNFDITGVDLIQRMGTDEWYVMEINAAPQFDGPEFEKVVDAISRYIK